jgi:hypothetical protein
LLERDAAFTPGSDFESARTYFSSSLTLIKKKTAAAAELKGLLSQIQSLKVGDSLPPTVGRAHLDTTALIPAESWVPGFGYASLQLAQAFSQEKGVWGDVLISTQAAVTARVEEKSTLDDESVAQQAADIAAQSDAYSVNNLYQKWAGEFSKSAKVENTLDLVFRN